MKSLSTHLLRRIALVIALLPALWGASFYVAVTNEVNDETDDLLEDLSEAVMMRLLSGQKMPPSMPFALNSGYHLHRLSPSQQQSMPLVHYRDTTMYIAYKRETEPARVLTTVFSNQQNEAFALEVYTPTFEKADILRIIGLWIVALYLTLFGTLLITTYLSLRRSLRPLRQLLQWLNSYRHGRHNAPLPTSNIKEVSILSEAVNDFSQRSEAVHEEQKQFIGNASHELQTPIAICRHRLEMLLEEGKLGEHEGTEIARTLHTLEHLTRLNRSLLLLSKIDNGQYAEQAPIDLTAQLDELLDDYRDIYAEREHRIEVQHTAHCVLPLHPTLCTTLLSNLLKNAFVHTPAQGYIGLSSTAQSVTISNTATEGPLDEQLIFKRFYSAHRTPENSGLGLAIAQAICQQHRLHLRYAYHSGQHHFSISAA